MKIDLENYEKLLLSKEEAYIKAAELLGLRPDMSDKDLVVAVNDYIVRNYTWYNYDIEYKYMGYDCGDCYMGGDVKKGIKCGDYLIIFTECPNYRHLSIWREKLKRI